MKKSRILTILFIIFLNFYFIPEVLGSEIIVEVDQDKIYLDDLFSNIQAFKNTAVADAPKFGEKLIISNHKLKQVAEKHTADIRPEWKDKQIIIVRSGVEIEPDYIVQLIKAAFDRKIANNTLGDTSDSNSSQSKNFQIEIHGKEKMYLPADSNDNLIVQSLQIDMQRQEFQALVVAPADHNLPHNKRGSEIAKVYSGSFKETLQVPVVTKFIKRGDLVTKNDYEMVAYDKSQIRGAIILDQSKIVGKEARTNLKIGDTFNGHSLKDPIMVKKGDMVRVRFVKDRINLSISMFALESGKLGEQISLKNTNSKKTILAKVVGFNKVEVN